MSDQEWIERFQALAAEQGLRVAELEQEIQEVHAQWDDDVDDRAMETQALRDERDRLRAVLEQITLPGTSRSEMVDLARQVLASQEIPGA